MAGPVGVLWAGKSLTEAEELQLRRAIALLRRMEERENGLAESRMELERFLPENDHRWTPNELESGAHLGPWMLIDAEVSDGHHSDGGPL